MQTPLIIKELIKHENTFNRKVFHEQEHSENRYQNFHSSWKATKIRHFSIVYTMKLSSNTYFIKCSERNISQCILALKQSHKIQYLFTLSYHFFTYFRFFLNFTLFHESLLLFHCLIDLVCSYIWKFPIISMFWSDMLSIAWYILDLLNVYRCICFGRYSEKITWYLGKVYKKAKTERVGNGIDAQSFCLRFTSFNLPLLYSLKPLIIYCCRICTILCMIFKKRLFIEALCRPLFTKYAHCKPVFPFQNNA